jgi:hypothetical protein
MTDANLMELNSSVHALISKTLAEKNQGLLAKLKNED